jgi:Leucine-rich repeat (LRR) protein
LEELNASFCDLKAESIDQLDGTRCRKLTELDLSNNKLKDNCLASLENIKCLNTLKLSNNCLRTLKKVSNIKSIKNLEVSNNQIESLNVLSSLIDLETLDASKNQIKSKTDIVNLQI